MRQEKVKAVGLISGGLDSTLAVKVVKDLGVEVYGVYFAMPWGCCQKTAAIEAAQRLGIKFIVMQLDERYLELIRRPKYGYGTALNPCVDCRIHMFSRAAQYMRHIEGSFVFTGEVLGQRPMSQKRHSMRWVEKGANLEGRLLRPLSARLLEPTIPEQEGLIDRSKLLAISGRSRKEQLAMARALGLTHYTAPAGGCLLTDANFARRMKDTLTYGYRNFRETVALQWGRHFRFNEQFRVILGRDEKENIALLRYAHPDDTIMQFVHERGPTLILKGLQPPHEILRKAGGLIQRFSRYRQQPPETMKYWVNKTPGEIQHITAGTVNDQELKIWAI